MFLLFTTDPTNLPVRVCVCQRARSQEQVRELGWVPENPAHF